jgi:lipoprotein-anchoring transpeptidase ErfK/SrfK
MFRKHLVNHVTRELEKGKTENEIIYSLLEDGWPKKDVDLALHYSMYPSELSGFSFKRFLVTELPMWVEVMSVFIIIGSFLFASVTFAYFREPIYNYKLDSTVLPNTQKPELKYGVEPALSDPNFFKSVHEKFIAQKVNFISANLAEMKLSLYKEGNLVKEVPILTKGREGSWWETPAGLYKIETKEKNHFSSFGQVYQPYSMAFQGNFFIHGWPHYPDGKPVASTYSGGCIRLSDEDASAIFSEVSVGTPVLVFEKDFAPDGKVFKAKGPSLSADQYLAVDVSSGYVFLSKDSKKVVPIASLTKLVTALVATEYLNLDSDITITNSMIIPTSKSRLKAGTAIPPYQLLFPLLLESSNEAAEALAQSIGRAKFISLMNEKAKAIGMTNTHFTDPAGREDGNVSTAEDLFALAKYITNNRSFLWNLSSGKLKVSAYGTIQFKNLGNFNDFSDDENFIGGKTGETTLAKQTGLYTFKINLGGEERSVVFIMLHSNDRKADGEAMLRYVKSNFN